MELGGHQNQDAQTDRPCLAIATADALDDEYGHRDHYRRGHRRVGLAA